MKKLEEKLKQLPDQSGVYIMRDHTGAIIYIGKAIVLKNRVRQYFNNSPKPDKVQAMADNVADFEYIITLTEKDALALESNLIKKHKPKYNILLKDDKSSPYIRIDTKDEFPSIEVTRKLRRDGARYFGPYFNGINVWDIVGIIRSAYQLRTCAKAMKKQSRECLNYHIKLCLAPCCGKASHAEYMEAVNRTIAFLTGREDSAQRLITQKMEQAREAEEFERAIVYRDQLAMLEKMKTRTIANLGNIFDVDSFAFLSSPSSWVASVCIVRGGKFMGVKNFSVMNIENDISALMSSFVTQYYSGNYELPDEICLPEVTDTSLLEEFFFSGFHKKVTFTFPKQGVKKTLLTIAEKNAADYLEKSVGEQKRNYDLYEGACKALQKILGLAVLSRIECYDISNISGVDKVASNVVFIDGMPSKKDYRKFKIKTVEGANDFASMSEVLSRRLERAKSGDEKFSALPDLIVVDGGKGQLSSAHAAMRACGMDIPMVGLAKREEEIFLVGESEPILLKKSDYALRLLQRVRDEAHRFAITYHRNLRKGRYDSLLESIPGVGEHKRKKLLAKFSFADISVMDEATLETVVDKKTAQSIAEYFKNNRKK